MAILAMSLTAVFDVVGERPARPRADPRPSRPPPCWRAAGWPRWRPRSSRTASRTSTRQSEGTFDERGAPRGELEAGRPEALGGAGAPTASSRRSPASRAALDGLLGMLDGLGARPGPGARRGGLRRPTTSLAASPHGGGGQGDHPAAADHPGRGAQEGRAPGAAHGELEGRQADRVLHRGDPPGGAARRAAQTRMPAGAAPGRSRRSRTSAAPPEAGSDPDAPRLHAASR